MMPVDGREAWDSAVRPRRLWPPLACRGAHPSHARGLTGGWRLALPAAWLACVCPQPARLVRLRLLCALTFLPPRVAPVTHGLTLSRLTCDPVPPCIIGMTS